MGTYPSSCVESAGEKVQSEIFNSLIYTIEYSVRLPPLSSKSPPPPLSIIYICLSVTVQFGFVIAVCSWFITFCPTWWRWIDEYNKVGLTALITDASHYILICENSLKLQHLCRWTRFAPILSRKLNSSLFVCLFIYLFFSIGWDENPVWSWLLLQPSRFHEWLTKLGPDVLINKEQALNKLVHWERADSLASVISFSSGVSSKNSLAANHT